MEDDKISFLDLRMRRTWKKDKILTFWEVRPAQDGFQFETKHQVGKFELPGLERTCQKVTILTFCEVRPSQMDVQFEAS